jgi:hypothetical protein
MTGIASKVRAAVALAPLALLASCASNKSAGPSASAQSPANSGPLTTLQAAEIAQRHVNSSDARLEIIDQVDDVHLFGVTSGFDAGGRPPRDSRLLFVHNDGTVRQWTGK